MKPKPWVRYASGREETYAQGKDTGRYWDAGASDVHWAVVTDRQVEEGFRDDEHVFRGLDHHGPLLEKKVRRAAQG